MEHFNHGAVGGGGGVFFFSGQGSGGWRKEDTNVLFVPLKHLSMSQQGRLCAEGG